MDGLRFSIFGVLRIDGTRRGCLTILRAHRQTSPGPHHSVDRRRLFFDAGGAARPAGALHGRRVGEAREEIMTALAPLPWVEKYRPKTVSEVSHQGEVVSSLRKSIEQKSLPHLIFYGRPQSQDVHHPRGGRATCSAPTTLARDGAQRLRRARHRRRPHKDQGVRAARRRRASKGRTRRRLS